MNRDEKAGRAESTDHRLQERQGRPHHRQIGFPIGTEHRGAARTAADVQRDRRERVFRGTGYRHRKTEYGNDRNIPRYGRTARKCEHIGEFALELSKADAVR